MIKMIQKTPGINHHTIINEEVAVAVAAANAFAKEGHKRNEKGVKVETITMIINHTNQNATEMTNQTKDRQDHQNISLPEHLLITSIGSKRC
jgi:long-subunit fatty acid transport protein